MPTADPVKRDTSFLPDSPTAYWSTNPHRECTLRQNSVWKRRIAVSEETRVIHVLVGVAMFLVVYILVGGRGFGLLPGDDGERRNGHVYH